MSIEAANSGLAIKSLRIKDVRAAMPNYTEYGNQYGNQASQRAITGVAIHHSAQVQFNLGLSVDNACSIFNFHVHRRGWEHGGYHYLIHANGLVEYALDEEIAGFHAGFHDPDDRLGLEQGQYWNNHYLAICMLGWFDTEREVTLANGETHKIPNRFTRPTEAQMGATTTLLQHLLIKYQIPPENVRGHRELPGCVTRCPGAKVEMDALRQRLQK